MTDQQWEQVLTQAIEELPARCKYTLGMLLEGATYEVIAAKLSTEKRPIDAATVEKLHHRAIEHVLEKIREAKVSLPATPRPPGKPSMLQRLGLLPG